AFFLAGVRERPRGVQGDLTPQQVLADLERDVVAFAHERDASPGVGAAHGLGTRLRLTRAVHRALGAVAVGEIVDRADGIALARVDRVLRPQLTGQLQALRRDVDRDDARSQRTPQQRRAQPDRPLAEDGERIAARDVEASQRAVGRAGAARPRRASLEAERVGQRDAGERRRLHEVCVATVTGDAVHRDALAAELRPAAAAVLAAPAALVVVIHHALADQSWVDAGADGMDDAARLVAGDHRSAAPAEAQARGGIAGGPVRVEVAAAHPRRLHGQHDLAGPSDRVGELLQLKLTISQEHHTTHGRLLRVHEPPGFTNRAPEILLFGGG